ncbi:pseudouridine synthase [Macroventuria anomochaeta]|uniref:Pseudouridine synthase n=1 Tax=Macroventuria anomochaeta TaxID=301207 RepID=A0ACB6SFY0_9PLEO|nr:pseudouridine synthase [Macroventuria anomochaeta]KAF2632944.1 pseudouridine synthase [Macroventuria anomochaeta]
MTTPPKEGAAAGRKVLEGVFAINKPQWASSAGVLRDLQTEFAKSDLFQPWLESTRRQMLLSGSKKKHVEQLKVKLGHGGTLDPMATGVLIVGAGKGTKELGKFLECTKSYECVVLFGAATDSYDAVGKIISKADYAHVTRELVEEKLKDFRGDIMQKPSVFSALKVDGKKMYEYAREGKDVPAVAARRVTVEELELVEWLEPGTHDFAWPAEEVDDEGKAGAEKLLGIRKSDAVQHLRNSKRARSPDTNPTAARSVTPASDHPIKDAGPQPKKPRTDSEPAMSGALPASTQHPHPHPHPHPQPLPLPYHAQSTSPSHTGPDADDVENAEDVQAQPQNTDENAALGSVERPLDADIPEPPVPVEKQPADSVEQAEVVDQAFTSAANQTPETKPIDKAHQPPAARLRMTVTSGFYVRSLCHDLGLACNSLGLMSSLVRSRQGAYDLGGENVLEYSDLEKGAGVWEAKVEGMLDRFMRREGWEQEVLEDEESWQARKTEFMANRKDDDRNRSYRGGGGGRGKYRGGGKGQGKYSKSMNGGRRD